MDLKTSNYLLPQEEQNPFEVSIPDNLCKLSLKENSMVKTNTVVEAPPTPGRPVFSFSIGSRKNFPSKWDDAEKWVIGGSDSPAHQFVKPPDFVAKNSSNNYNGFVGKQEKLQKTEVCSDKQISVFQVPKTVSVEQDHRHQNSATLFTGLSPPSDSSDVLLKDKFTNGSQPNVSRFKCLVPINQEFLFNSMKDASTEVIQESKTKTKTTPFTCSSSPPLHNTPASLSGPLTLLNPSSSFDIAELQECHFAKLQQDSPFDSGICNWSSREEEEEDISKSLRHSEMNNECSKNVAEIRDCVWEEEGKTKSHLRYQREEAKIQAWVNLEKAKAEAQSRKLEVKIQKMRSKFEEKMMKKMASVHRKAEELRLAAKREHDVEIQKSMTIRSKKIINFNESMHFSGHKSSCGCCFPCSTTLDH